MSVFRWLSGGTAAAARYLNSCPDPCGKALGKNWNKNDQRAPPQSFGKGLDKSCWRCSDNALPSVAL